MVIDCATRMIVGWAMDDNYKTPLITSAIKMAARNVDLPEGGSIPLRPRKQLYVSRVRQGCSRNWGYASPSAGPESATIMPWPNR